MRSAKSARTAIRVAYPPSRSQPVNSRSRAEVLAARQAVLTLPAGRREPRYSGPFAHFPAADILAELVDTADRLVTRHYRQPTGLEIALDQLEIGSAHRARGDVEDQLTCRRPRLGELDQCQR